jgi:hypothetical protein
MVRERHPMMAPVTVLLCCLWWHNSSKHHAKDRATYTNQESNRKMLQIVAAGQPL